MLPWVKEELKKLFVNTILFEQDDMKFTTTRVLECTGEAFVAMRKNKWIANYELNIQIEFESQISNKKMYGQISMPYVSVEESDEEFEIRCSSEGNIFLSTIIQQSVREKMKILLNRLRNGANLKKRTSKSPTASPSNDQIHREPISIKKIEQVKKQTSTTSWRNIFGWGSIAMLGSIIGIFVGKSLKKYFNWNR